MINWNNKLYIFNNQQDMILFTVYVLYVNLRKPTIDMVYANDRAQQKPLRYSH